jgi:hypothetical protein
MARWQTVLIAALANAIGGQALAGVTPDVNRDGIVSAIDVALVARCLGQHPKLDCATADVDHDGDVDNADLRIVVNALNARRFTPTSTPPAAPYRDPYAAAGRTTAEVEGLRAS